MDTDYLSVIRHVTQPPIALFPEKAHGVSQSAHSSTNTKKQNIFYFHIILYL
jgi:hypothetical protein